MSNFDNIKHDLRHRLEHLSISHSTFKPEFVDEECGQPKC
jgi:cobalt-zinc-cadmium efflux system protein